ncbi:MAG: hypothetical protein KBH71_04235 [Anaerolineae bacterium]|nr:hypothetical protein [Anaerolineae bacterium]
MQDFPLAATLRPLQRAVRRHDALHGAAWGSAIGLTLALLLALAARLAPLWPRSTLLAHLGPLLLCPLGGALWGGWRPRPVIEQLRRLERATGLAERLSTAWELHTGVITSSPALREAQRAETARALQSLDPRRAFPLRPSPAAAILNGALLLAVLAALFVPNPQERVLAERAALQQAAARQAEELAAQMEAVREIPNLSSAERERLLQSLEAARQILLDPHAAPEARQAALLEAEQQLAGLRQAQEDTARQLREALAATPTEAPTERIQALLAALQRGDLAAAETAARQLAEGEALSSEEQAALNAALAQLAEAAQAVDPELAEALAAAATARDAGEATAALQALAGELAQQQQERAAKEAQLAGLQAGLQSGREQLAAAQQAAVGEGGFPQAGSGVSQHSEDSGSAAPYGPSASARLQGTGSEITLPRAVVSGDTSSTGPGAETAARVPYDEVYPTYAEAAAAALSRQPLPPGLRASIHSYFSALAPADAATP